MKKKYSNIWDKLADLPIGGSVKGDWQGFPEELLELTNIKSPCVPCNMIDGCYMNVVHHGPGDIVGVCTSYPKQCDRRKVDEAELEVYRIDPKKLATKSAKAIGFTEEFEEIEGHTALWKFGVLKPQDEHSFPVYCCLDQTAWQFEKIIYYLCMGDQNFLLLTATSSLISSDSSDVISRHKSKIIVLDDVFDVDSEGKVTVKSSAQKNVSNWLEQLLDDGCPF